MLAVRYMARYSHQHLESDTLDISGTAYELISSVGMYMFSLYFFLQ